MEKKGEKKQKNNCTCAHSQFHGLFLPKSSGKGQADSTRYRGVIHKESVNTDKQIILARELQRLPTNIIFKQGGRQPS